jgi:hypothetical protein
VRTAQWEAGVICIRKEDGMAANNDEIVRTWIAR